MKSGTFTNNTSFTASAATVDVPTGSVTISTNMDFTVPAGVNVIKVNTQNNNSFISYVGVTPGAKHHLHIFIRSNQGLLMYGLACTSHTDIMWIYFMIPAETYPIYELSWSPEINKMTPNVTDYN